MSTIYLIDDTLADEKKLLRETLSAHYNVKMVPTIQALGGVLKEQTQAVVIFRAEPKKMALQTAQIKNVLSSAACILVCEQADVEHVPGVRFEWDFLPSPMTSFDILSRVSTALRQTELQARIDSFAQLDEITQLYNRRYFLNRLNEEISLARRHHTQLACAVIGINFYQAFLDSYGYDFVNDLLRTVAAVVQEHKRNEDVIARISDDEIALLLPRSSEKGAGLQSSRILKAVSDLDFKFGDVTESISLATGVVGFPVQETIERRNAATGDEKINADVLLRYARHALHNARHQADFGDECAEDEAEPTIPLALFSEIQPTL